ncbi:hypothetical protein Trydic_g9890 [Trypoxylus dichotomus]
MQIGLETLKIDSWSSRKQTSVALSTAEAEYAASASCGAEISYVIGFATDFERKHLKCIMKIDNQSTINMLRNWQNTKHIDIKIHFVRDLVIKGVINVIYVESNNNIADMFTKSLCTDRFVALRTSLGM